MSLKRVGFDLGCGLGLLQLQCTRRMSAKVLQWQTDRQAEAATAGPTGRQTVSQSAGVTCGWCVGAWVFAWVSGTWLTAGRERGHGRLSCESWEAGCLIERTHSMCAHGEIMKKNWIRSWKVDKMNFKHQESATEREREGRSSKRTRRMSVAQTGEQVKLYPATLICKSVFHQTGIN